MALFGLIQLNKPVALSWVRASRRRHRVY